MAGTAAIAVFLPVKRAAGGIEALFAPKPNLWPRWQDNEPASTASMDHRAWDRFLKAQVKSDKSGINRVAYGAIDPRSRAALATYIASLSNQMPSRFNRMEQLAFWINLYNALTVRLVSEHYPVKSILDISPGFFSRGPWDMKLIRIEGEEVSLNDIEHRILRPIWHDPRLHYAVNCASLGCPNLQRSAFTAANATALLETGARSYVNHPRGASFRDGKLAVSSIYAWFQRDFGNDDAGVIAHLKRYAEPMLAEQLKSVTEIGSHHYDWALNDTARSS